MAEQTFKVGDKANYVGKPVTIAGGPFEGYSGWYAVKGEDGKEHPAAASGLTAVPAFAVGDTVRYAYGSGGKLVAGPFKSEHHDELLWVVEKPNGTHMTPTQNSLTKVEESDPIKVGDRVRVLEDGANCADVNKGDEFTVTDVRKRSDGTTIVVEDDGYGHWYFQSQNVEKLTAPAADTFTHDGVTYELGVDYEDRDGDRWKFARIDGEIFGEWGLSRNHIAPDSGYRIAYAVSQYGPFTRV